MLKQSVHRNIFLGSLIALAVAMPLSMFLMSFSQIVLTLNWIVEGRFGEKWRRLKQNKSIVFFLVLFAAHLVGLVYSDNWLYGLHDLKVKLPLLFLPLVLGTSDLLEKKHWRVVIYCFIGAVFAATCASMAVALDVVDIPFRDSRNLSLFIWHIRYALFIDMAIFSLFYFIFDGSISNRKVLIMLFILALWLLVFLFILQSFTGIVVLLVVGILLLLYYIFTLASIRAKLLLLIPLLLVPLVCIGYVGYVAHRYYNIERIDVKKLETHTALGNLYGHNLNDKSVENGHYVWLYVAEDELAKAWDKRSKVNFYGKDTIGQDLKYTLVRYLASRGLRKDAQGLSALGDDEIHEIECGVSNYLFRNKLSLYKKVYEVIWQFDDIKNGGDPSGHSITQRFVYLKAALNIIGQHAWFGVGNGDVGDAYKAYYASQTSGLSPRWQLRAHNQLITLVISFGIVGFLCILVALFISVYKVRRHLDYFSFVFLAVAILSMLNDDTLETLAGSVFFAFFYSFFLFCRQDETPA